MISAIAETHDCALGQDEQLSGSGDAGSLGEDVVVGCADLVEEMVVDGDEYPEGGAAVGVDEGKEAVGGGVVLLGRDGEGLKNGALIRLEG